MLEDGGQYIGVSAETSALLPAQVDHKLEAAIEDGLHERLHRLAAEENPGGTVQSICRKIYSKQGQQKVEIDAAVVVRFPADQPPVAYLAERKRTLNLNAFYEVENKWALIRGWRDDIPELQEDYGGVQQAELFLCADVLASNLTVEEVANESLRCKIRVFTRNGKEYDVENQCWPQL